MTTQSLHHARAGAVTLAAIALAACSHSAPITPSPTPVPPPIAAAASAPDSTTLAHVDTTPAYRKQAPTLAAAPSVKLPPIVRRTLPNGMTLLVVEQHELPLADFVLLVGTGGEADPANRVGLATFTANMLTEGTTSRTSLQIDDQQAYLGVSLSTGSGWDASRVLLHTPTAQLDSALALFADVSLHPVFPAKELERLRKERLAQLLQLKDRAPAMADLAYSAILFGTQHPYGHPLFGSEESTTSLTRADLQRFYQAYYRPNNATLIVVGDVKPDDIQRRVEKLFGSWKQAKVPQATFPAPPASATTAIYLVDKPGAPQSSVRIGSIGVPRSSQDYFAIVVMNTILGGAFTSRLNMNLRETHGYTYGAGSGFGMRRSAGPFVARAEVTGTKTDSSVAEFLHELTAIRDTVPAGELAKAKRYLELQLPGDFETTEDIASQLIPVVLYNLPLDYYDNYVANIEHVTQADVQRVAQRYVDPQHVAIVVVGDRKSVEAGLKGLNVGPVSIRDMTGQPVEK